MSNYVPWYGKKKAALGYREEKLLRALRRGGSSEQVTRLAEEVRAARARWLRSERSRILCNGLHADRIREFDERIRACETEPTEAILTEFRRRFPACGNLPGVDDESADRA